LLDNYYLPGELEDRVRQLVDYYNHERFHESLDKLTPADVYYGRGPSILDRRERIKLDTLAMRWQMLWVPKIGACWFCCIFLDDG